MLCVYLHDTRTEPFISSRYRTLSADGRSTIRPEPSALFLRLDWHRSDGPIRASCAGRGQTPDLSARESILHAHTEADEYLSFPAAVEQAPH